MAAPIDPRIKAAALADVAMGAPIATTAKKYKIARATLNNWVDEACLDSVQTQDQRDEIGELVHTWMIKCMQALIVHLDVSMDKGWLLEHSPSDLANITAILTERFSRMAQTQQERLAEDSAPTPIRRAG